MLYCSQDWIARKAGEAMATGFVEAIEQALQPVRYFPMAGAPRDYLAAGLRVTFHERFAIYYRVGADAVLVARVLHGARDVAKLIRPDEFG